MNRIGPWSAFKTGFIGALRHWPLWLPFYAALALLAGLLLLPVEAALLDWIGHRLAAGELADGLDAWLALETVQQIAEQGGLGSMAGGLVFLALLALPAWPLVLSLPFVVLSGGALAIYAQTNQQTRRTSRGKTDWPRFWKGLTWYAPPFILLLLIEIILIEVVLLGVIMALVAVASAGGTMAVTVAMIPALLLLVAVFMLVPWWVSYARLIAVVEQKRHVLQVLGRAASFLWRNFGPVAGLSLLNFPLSPMLSLLYALLTWPLPASWWIGQVILQQLFILGRIGVRLVRLSTEVCLVQGRREIADA